MVPFRERGEWGAGRRRLSPGVVCLALGLAMLAGLSGCGGCRQDPAEAQKEREKKEAEARAKEKEKPKPDFVVSRLATRPASGKLGEGPDALGPPYKPGHWTATTLAAKTNNFDFVGDLEIAAVDRKADPVPLSGAGFHLSTSRQVTLPKRQPKLFESILLVPAADRPPMVSCRLRWAKGGRRAWDNQPYDRLARMPSYQYHFPVLARYPERYKYLEGLASVKPLSDEFETGPGDAYYRVCLMRADRPNRRPLLPSYGLLWTSIAYVLWDDAEPDCLSLDQQQALLDWLHWGGQLILSGPDTLDSLRDSFLGAYLPAAAAGVRELGEADFEPLYRWSNKPVERLPFHAKWTGVTLQPRPRARFLPGSGELLVERRLGRGRIVVSAFRLSGRELTGWPGWDEVFNAFLLGRKPRTVIQGRDLQSQVTWADAPGRGLDAGRISKLRYFARDTGVEFAAYGADVLRPASDVAWTGVEDASPAGPGVAAWNDFGPVANRARTALRSAAQIEIPDRSFVLWIVAGYLLVLVPANWAVFRLAGRVEWAWIAAPMIAIVCTVFVIRAAQLDIGFARSRTEIAVIEIQPGYPRAHVTRYTALYTSLTTEYDFHFEDSAALVQPFPKLNQPAAFSDHRGVLFRRGKNARLEDYFVRSNSTGMMHSEHVVDLGGSLSLRQTAGGSPQLVNGTQLTLYGAGVVRRDESGGLQIARVGPPAGETDVEPFGTLEPGATVALSRFRPVSTRSDGLFGQQRLAGLALVKAAAEPGELDLGPLVDLALGGKELQPGQMRLIAALKKQTLKEQVPGPAIRPAAPQAHLAGLVVAHLEYGHAEDPQPDKRILPRPGRPKVDLPETGEPSFDRPEPEDGFSSSAAPQSPLSLQRTIANP